MKKRILSVLSLCLVFGMLCAAMLAFAGCGDDDKNENGGTADDGAFGASGGSASIDGKYYRVEDGEAVSWGHFEFGDGRWSLVYGNDNRGGAYELNRATGAITLKYRLTGDDDPPVEGNVGEDVVLFKGTIGDGVFTVTWVYLGDANQAFYRDGVVPGENKLPGGLGTAGNPGNTGTPGNGGNGSGVNGSYTDADGIETVTLQNGKWSVTSGGYTVDGDYEQSGSEITFYMDMYGEKITLYTGTVSGNKLTLYIPSTDETAVYYKD